MARNRLLRESLSRILRRSADIAVVGECLDCSNLPGMITRFEPDVVLMDSPKPCDSHLQIVASARSTNPNLQIIMVGMDDADESMFLDAVRAGIAGYLLNDASAIDVIDAIRLAALGEAICPRRFCRTLFQYVAQSAASLPKATSRRDFGLTRRQLELVPMIARGLTNKEIASHLNLSEQTVKNHIHRMLHKVGAEHRLRIAEIVMTPPL